MSAWTRKGFSIVRAQVPKGLLDEFHYEARLDRIGPAYFVPSELLDYLINISIFR
jgi:hypothetical protein